MADRIDPEDVRRTARDAARRASRQDSDQQLVDDMRDLLDTTEES